MTDPHPHGHYSLGFPSQGPKLSSGRQASEGPVSSAAVSKEQGNSLQILALSEEGLYS